MLEVKEIKNVTGSCLVLIALLFSFAEGYDEDNTFTGGFSSPYLQADYIQNLTEHSAALINPALIWRVNQLYAEAGYFNWGWGVADVEETQSLYYLQGTFLVPLRLNHTAGVSLIGASSTIDETILDPQTKTVSTKGGSLSWYEWWITFHYCYKIFPWLSVGANPKLVLQNQFDAKEGKQIGGGLDVGVYGTVFDHYRFGDLGLSVSFIDLIPAHVEWEGSEEKQQMTTRMRAGFRYKGLNERLVIAYDVNIDNIFAGWQNILDGQTTINDTTVDTTVTPYDTTIVEKDIKEQLMDRVGRYSAHAKFEVMPQLSVKGGWGNNNIPYIGFNFNVLYPMVQSINKFDFDFHIGYSLNETERGFTLMTKVSSLFGPTREQRESRRLHDKLMLAPRDAYNKAMRLYSAGKYWEASYAFGKVLTLYPNFHLNDKAAYYMGDSYSELRLNNIARKVFEEALDEYSTSDMRADYLYGLERLDYREGKFKSALKNHAFISNLYPDDEITSDAHYIAGEIHFKRKNYSTAKELFLKVKPEAESYIYAQYSLSVINVIKKKKKAAITNLENIFADTSSEIADLDLKAAASIKLGQLYFEEVELRKAAEAFKRVLPGNDRGDEALLGLSWCWIKAGRPDESRNAADELISLHPESQLVPEAYLLRGYAYMLEEQYQKALKELKTCIEICNSKDFTDKEDLRKKRGEFEEEKKEFAPYTMRIYKNAMRKPSPTSIQEREEYKKEYEVFDEASTEYFETTLRVKRNNQFFRRKKDIIADAEYAIAKANQILGSMDQQEVLEEHKEKKEEVDEEMKNLKERLERLNKGE